MDHAVLTPGVFKDSTAKVTFNRFNFVNFWSVAVLTNTIHKLVSTPASVIIRLHPIRSLCWPVLLSVFAQPLLSRRRRLVEPLPQVQPFPLQVDGSLFEETALKVFGVENESSP
jgi:hypothetical protein